MLFSFRLSRLSNLREPFDGNRAARSNLHFQFIAAQERHPDEGVRIGFVYKHTALFAIPDYLSHVNVKEAFAAVGKDSAAKGFPTKPER